MSARVVVAICAAAILGLGALVVGAVVARDGAGPARESFRGSPPPTGIFLPDFRLRDYSGEVVDSRTLRGKVVVVTFLETRCTEACPAIAAQIGRAVRSMTPAERRRVVTLGISTHPGDDTPAAVRRFLRARHAERELRYLIGSERELRPVWKAFYVLPALDTGDADTHSAPVRIFDREGEWVSSLHEDVDLSPANLVHDVTVALSRS